MTEQWIKWEPLEGIVGKYSIDSILDHTELFTIILSGRKGQEKKVKIVFSDGVHVYRHTDEKFRLKNIHDVDDKYGTKFYAYWTFFKVVDSEYIQLVLSQLDRDFKKESYIHFAFRAGDSILDVITNYEPIVEFIK